jgi:hypothetical protein
MDMDWIGIILLSTGLYILGYDTGVKDRLKWWK